MRQTIPLNRASVLGNELSFVREAVNTGSAAAKGPFSARVSELLRNELGSADVLLTTSCTTALELAAMLAPGQAEVFYNLGHARYRLGDWAGAAKAYVRTLEIEPSLYAFLVLSPSSSDAFLI